MKTRKRKRRGRPKKGFKRLTVYLPAEMDKAIRDEHTSRLDGGEIDLTISDIVIECISSRTVFVRRAT